MTKKQSQTMDNVDILKQNFYKEGVKVEIEGRLLLELLSIFDLLIKDEVRSESKFKYNYVDNDGKVVKNAKESDIQSGKVRKILDWNRTIVEPTLEYSISEKGILYSEIVSILQSVHYENIKAGNTIQDLIHRQEISK